MNLFVLYSLSHSVSQGCKYFYIGTKNLKVTKFFIKKRTFAYLFGKSFSKRFVLKNYCLCCNKDFLSLSIFFWLSFSLSVYMLVYRSVCLFLFFFFYGNFVLICLTFTFMFQNFQFLRSSEEDKCGSSKECVPITQCTEMILLINKVKMKCNEKISIIIKENNR